jgi:hypothetical protein
MHPKHYLILLLLLSSCMSVEKATVYLQSKGKLAEVCADGFPIKERVIQGETIIEIDSIFVPGDSVECPPSLSKSDKSIKVKCPDHRVEVRHSFRVDTLVQENTAKVEMYKTKYLQSVDESKILTTELRTIEQSRDKWKLRFFGLLLGIVVLTGGYLFLKFYLVR